MLELIPELLKFGADGILLAGLIVVWRDHIDTRKKLSDAEARLAATEKRCAEERAEDARKAHEREALLLHQASQERVSFYERWDKEGDKREQAVLEACDRVTIALTKATAARKGGQS